MHKYDSTMFRVVLFMEYIENDADILTEFLKCCLFENDAVRNAWQLRRKRLIKHELS